MESEILFPNGLIRIIWTNEPYDCEICEKVFDSEVHAMVHVTQEHTNSEQLCHLLGKEDEPELFLKREGVTWD